MHQKKIGNWCALHAYYMYTIRPWSPSLCNCYDNDETADSHRIAHMNTGAELNKIKCNIYYCTDDRFDTNADHQHLLHTPRLHTNFLRLNFFCILFILNFVAQQMQQQKKKWSDVGRSKHWHASNQPLLNKMLFKKQNLIRMLKKVAALFFLTYYVFAIVWALKVYAEISSTVTFSIAECVYFQNEWE